MLIVYWIKSIHGNSNYIGSAVDFKKRILQHNGVIPGGAKYTMGKQWRPHKLIRGFENWNECLKFEIYAKKAIKHKKSIKSKNDSFLTYLDKHPHLSLISFEECCVLCEW